MKGEGSSNIEYALSDYIDVSALELTCLKAASSSKEI